MGTKVGTSDSKPHGHVTFLDPYLSPSLSREPKGTAPLHWFSGAAAAQTPTNLVT